MVADAKYATTANYRFLEKEGIAASIPLHATKATYRALTIDAFVYDEANDQYRCPEGQILRRQGKSATAGAMGGIIYRARPAVCAAGPPQGDLLRDGPSPHGVSSRRWGRARSRDSLRPNLPRETKHPSAQGVGRDGLRRRERTARTATYPIPWTGSHADSSTADGQCLQHPQACASQTDQAGIRGRGSGERESHVVIIHCPSRSSPGPTPKLTASGNFGTLTRVRQRPPWVPLPRSE